MICPVTNVFDSTMLRFQENSVILISNQSCRSYCVILDDNCMKHHVFINHKSHCISVTMYLPWLRGSCCGALKFEFFSSDVLFLELSFSILHNIS